MSIKRKSAISTAEGKEAGESGDASDDNIMEKRESALVICDWFGFDKNLSKLKTDMQHLQSSHILLITFVQHFLPLKTYHHLYRSLDIS